MKAVILSGHLHKELVNHDHDMLLLGAPAISFGFPRNAKLEGWMMVTIWKDREPTFESSMRLRSEI